MCVCIVVCMFVYGVVLLVYVREWAYIACVCARMVVYCALNARVWLCIVLCMLCVVCVYCVLHAFAWFRIVVRFRYGFVWLCNVGVYVFVWLRIVCVCVRMVL